jgi:hypothetical protein
LQDIMGCNQPFVGKVMLFTGDFSKYFPLWHEEQVHRSLMLFY